MPSPPPAPYEIETPVGINAIRTMSGKINSQSMNSNPDAKIFESRKKEPQRSQIHGESNNAPIRELCDLCGCVFFRGIIIRLGV